MADGSPCWFDDHAVGAFMPADLGSPRQLVHHHGHHQSAAGAYHGGQQPQRQMHGYCKPELEYHHLLPQEAFLQYLPQLESPKPPPAASYIGGGHGSNLGSSSTALTHDDEASGSAAQPPPPSEAVYMAGAGFDASVTDWKLLDKFVASQLLSKESPYSNPAHVFQAADGQHEEALDYASTSVGSGGGEADLWK
ncbi:hypothetical protein ABZP36_032344 [Zizania latifolia]